MLGRIDLKNPRECSFKENSPQSALRPQSQIFSNIFIYVEGTFFIPGRPSTRLEDIYKLYVSAGAEEVQRRLEGLFFIYIHDREKHHHFLINNRYQLTHLYYGVVDDQLVFSNRLKALLAEMPSVLPHFPSIANFLANGFNVSDQTQVAGVKKLLPTYRIEVKGQGLELFHFWPEQITFERKPFSDLEKHLDTYEEIYRRTLGNYLEARQPNELATLLSGGHDTSFVMLQSSKVFPKPVHAFTAVFPGWNFNEHEYAENICKKSGGVFHKVPFEPEHLDDVVDMIRACEEPVLGSTLPLHRVAKEARQVTDTILGGDGGDTMWGEYYPVGEYHRWVKNHPLAVRRAAHWVSKKLRDLTDWERFWELEHVAELFTHDDTYGNFMQRLCTYRHFNNGYLQELFDSSVFPVTYQKSLMEIPFTRDNFDSALIEGKLFNAFYTYQSFQQTKSMNSLGLEFYLPTINKELLKFITELPPEWVNGGNTFQRLSNNKKINRRFHKKALARYLKSDEIYNRSFDVPWFQIIKPRAQLLNVLEERLVRRGWYNEDVIRRLFSEFRQQKDKEHEIIELKSHGYRILALLSLEVWAMEYLDGSNSPNQGGPVKLEEYLADGI